MKITLNCYKQISHLIETHATTVVLDDLRTLKLAQLIFCLGDAGWEAEKIAVVISSKHKLSPRSATHILGKYTNHQSISKVKNLISSDDKCAKYKTTYKYMTNEFLLHEMFLDPSLINYRNFYSFEK